MICSPHKLLTIPPTQRNVPSGSLMFAQPSWFLRVEGKSKQNQRGDRAQHHSYTKGEQRALQAEPSGQHRH